MDKNSKKRKTSRIGPKKGKEAEILLKSKFIKEDLPLPFVLYPRIGGTFIGFSSKTDGEIFFCSCMEPAIENYISLIKQNPKGTYLDTLVMAPLSSQDFPPKIAEISLNHNANPKNALNFKSNICHKCNMATPTVRAISPMYGGKFKQYYGWYIRQQYLHLGILKNQGYLEDKCPDEIIELLEAKNEAAEEVHTERMKLNEMVRGPKRDDIADDEITFWHNVKLSEAETYKRLDKKSRTLHRKLSNKIENIVRQEFAFRKVGDGWISESILFKVVSRLFPENEIKRHYRPVWLDGLELDIYVPQHHLAFEYQGQQHYHPIKAWGGKKALLEVQKRDSKKSHICQERGINLVKVDYTEPLTEKHIRERLNEIKLK